MLDSVPAAVPYGKALKGEWCHGVPLLLAQGVPGLVDAVPVTSPPVAGGSGPRSGGGSPQQAERTRAEETLRVSAGGNSSSIPLPQGAHGGVAAPSHDWVHFLFHRHQPER